MTPGQAVELPSAGLFAGSIGVYANVDNGRTVPGSALGCTVADDRGQVLAGGGVSTDDLKGFDRIVIDGVAVRPVLRVAEAGRTMRCTGDAVSALAPVYVRAQPGVDAMVPMAAWSLTSLLIVLGLSGVVILRPEDA